MAQDDHSTVALRSTSRLLRANIPSVSVHDGRFLSRRHCASRMVALARYECCRVLRFGSAEEVVLNDGCCVNKKMVEAKMAPSDFAEVLRQTWRYRSHVPIISLRPLVHQRRHRAGDGQRIVVRSSAVVVAACKAFLAREHVISAHALT